MSEIERSVLELAAEGVNKSGGGLNVSRIKKFLKNNIPVAKSTINSANRDKLENLLDNYLNGFYDEELEGEEGGSSLESKTKKEVKLTNLERLINASQEKTRQKGGFNSEELRKILLFNEREINKKLGQNVQRQWGNYRDYWESKYSREKFRKGKRPLLQQIVKEYLEVIEDVNLIKFPEFKKKKEKIEVTVERLINAAEGLGRNLGGLNLDDIRSYLIEKSNFKASEIRKADREELNILLKKYLDQNTEIEYSFQEEQEVSIEDRLELTGVKEIDIKIIVLGLDLTSIDQICELKSDPLHYICQEESLWRELSESINEVKKDPKTTWKNHFNEKRLKITPELIESKSKPKLKLLKALLQPVANDLNYYTDSKDDLKIFIDKLLLPEIVKQDKYYIRGKLLSKKSRKEILKSLVNSLNSNSILDIYNIINKNPVWRVLFPVPRFTYELNSYYIDKFDLEEKQKYYQDLFKNGSLEIRGNDILVNKWFMNLLLEVSIKYKQVYRAFLWSLLYYLTVKPQPDLKNRLVEIYKESTLDYQDDQNKTIELVINIFRLIFSRIRNKNDIENILAAVYDPFITDLIDIEDVMNVWFTPSN